MYILLTFLNLHFCVGHAYVKDVDIYTYGSCETLVIKFEAFDVLVMKQFLLMWNLFGLRFVKNHLLTWIYWVDVYVVKFLKQHLVRIST